MAVHTRSVDAKHRFRHEGGNQTVLCRNGFDSVFQGNNIICRFKCIIEAEIDLVLAKGNFMMAHFDLQPHFTECRHQLTANAGSFIVGGEIKIPTHIVRNRMHITVLARAKQEEFRFRAYIEFPTALLDDVQLAAQGSTGIAFKWRTIGAEDIAEHTGTFMSGRGPGQHGVSIEIRSKQHIAFLNTGEAFNGRTIKPQAILDCFFDLFEGSVHTFDCSGNICKLERDKLDAICLDSFKQLFFIHTISP
ncbi:hypothetical protein SDC9_144322 [bioreactor metagenome]|uniref:Uncharacterized protein n=1 Tax=bioreactor metagenome TaxID=1076179 RepID=A0A645E6I4_9ZZZZ